MSQDPSNFDAPPLKRALRDLAAEHRASPALRDRVARAMSAEPVDTAPLKLARSAQSPFRRYLTTAAAIVIGLGAAYAGYDWYASYRARHTRLSYDYEIAANVVNDMIATHQRGKSLSTDGPATSRDAASLKAPLTDPNALAKEASDRLNRPVPPPTLGGGWSLDQDALCSIGGYDAVRFHFTKGTQGVTLVSLPAAAWANRQRDQYCTTSDGYPIAGYIAGPSLNCVIGDRGIPEPDVNAIATALRTR